MIRSTFLQSVPVWATLYLLLLASQLGLVSPVQGAALTTAIPAHEKSCFYTWVDISGEKVGFYFAVQSGGNFDIDWEIRNPNNRIIIKGDRDRQTDIIFTGNVVGEYSFCFENEFSSFAEKLVDFDITVESEPRLDVPLSSQSPLLTEKSAPLEESISKVGGKLTGIARTQRYFRTRENRNFATVKNTQSKLFYFSLLESILFVSVSVAQVYLVRYMFNTGSTKRYRV